jgi:hypothetical protein
MNHKDLQTVRTALQNCMPPQGYERDQQWVNALDILNAELDKPDEPVGHLDGLDMNADFMSLEIRKAHEARNSSTPRTYTIPVYTRPQSCECCKEQEVKPLPGADWAITMRRMMSSGCSKRECTCKPENEKDCIWWDEPGDRPAPIPKDQTCECCKPATFSDHPPAPIPPADLMPYDNKGMP